MDDRDRIYCAAFGGVIVFAISVIVITVMHNQYNAELIKRGLKAYNQTTGVLEWTQKAAE